jgi:hypothetical protein
MTDSLRKGIADEQLAKKDQERGRKRDRQEELESSQSKRRRSISSISSRSVSTISTNRSRSPPPRAQLDPASEKKRRRDSVSSVESYSSDDQYRGKRRDRRSESRSTRRKYTDVSPPLRGRSRKRSSSSTSQDRPSRDYSEGELPRHENERARRRSPHGRDIENVKPQPERYASPSERADGGHQRRAHDTEDSGHNRRYRDDDRYQTTAKMADTSNRASRGSQNVNTGPPRERSLSPFSKRLVLTQAMNTR